MWSSRYQSLFFRQSLLVFITIYSIYTKNTWHSVCWGGSLGLGPLKRLESRGRRGICFESARRPRGSTHQRVKQELKHDETGDSSLEIASCCFSFPLLFPLLVASGRLVRTTNAPPRCTTREIGRPAEARNVASGSGRWDWPWPPAAPG